MFAQPKLMFYQRFASGICKQLNVYFLFHRLSFIIYHFPFISVLSLSIFLSLSRSLSRSLIHSLCQHLYIHNPPSLTHTRTHAHTPIIFCPLCCHFESIRCNDKKRIPAQTMCSDSVETVAIP